MRAGAIFVALLFAMMSFTSLAQAPASKVIAKERTSESSPVSPPSAVSASSRTDTGKTEADLYKLLYEGQKEANRDLTQVMYWSIGLVATFLLAIAGSQVFFNFRLRKSDIDNLQKTNAKQISESLAFAKEEIAGLVREGETENRAAREELSKYLSERIDTVVARTDSAEKSIEALGSRLAPLEKLTRKCEVLEVEVTELEAQVWRLRGVESNALSRFVKICELLIDRDRPATLKYRLSDVEDALSKLTEIRLSSYNALEALMPKIPEKFQEHRDRIFALYDKLPVYEFDKSSDEDVRSKVTWYYVRNAPDKE